MNDLEEQLASPGVEDEDGAIDRFGGQIALECLVDSHSVHIGVIHKPNDLIAEQLSIVLTGQVGLSWFRAVELQSLPDPLSEHIQSRVGLHDLGHGLLDQWLAAREPVTEGGVKVVGQVNANEQTSGGGVDGHVVSGVVQELGPGIPE